MKPGIRSTEAIGGAGVIALLAVEGRELPPWLGISIAALGAVYIISRTWLKAHLTEPPPVP